jgi:hypothetical protein
MRCYLHGTARSVDCSLCCLFSELEDRAPGTEIAALREQIQELLLLALRVDDVLEAARRTPLSLIPQRIVVALKALGAARKAVGR